jgi:hypothetical protein
MTVKAKEYAFPDPHIVGDKGLTIRDYFAIRIFMEFMKNTDTDFDDDCEEAYRIADKLIKARDA